MKPKVATNEAIFNINPESVNYVPDILDETKYMNVKREPYNSNVYNKCKKSKCDVLLLEQKQVDDIKKIVSKIQK